jgi:hypothetical protein
MDIDDPSSSNGSVTNQQLIWDLKGKIESLEAQILILRDVAEKAQEANRIHLVQIELLTANLNDLRVVLGGNSASMELP